MATEIDWYDDTIPIEKIVRHFGAAWIAWFLADLTVEEALIRISCRMDDNWHGNQRETFAHWRSLARAIREGRFTIPRTET